MKVCPKCHKEYNDDFSFCNMCGEKLNYKSNLGSHINNNRNMVIAAIFIAIVAIIVIGITLLEKKKIKDARQAIEDYKYEKAIQEYRTTPTESDISINSDWTTEKSGKYVYIKGSVTNTSSSKTISYFEVEAKFYDSKGKVIDSDYTNDGDDLEPGETRQFEIMHKYDGSMDNIRLSIKDVR